MKFVVLLKYLKVPNCILWLVYFKAIHLNVVPLFACIFQTTYTGIKGILVVMHRSVFIFIYVFNLGMSLGQDQISDKI